MEFVTLVIISITEVWSRRIMVESWLPCFLYRMTSSLSWVRVVSCQQPNSSFKDSYLSRQITIPRSIVALVAEWPLVIIVTYILDSLFLTVLVIDSVTVVVVVVVVVIFLMTSS